MTFNEKIGSYASADLIIKNKLKTIKIIKYLFLNIKKFFFLKIDAATIIAIMLTAKSERNGPVTKSAGIRQIRKYI